MRIQLKRGLYWRVQRIFGMYTNRNYNPADQQLLLNRLYEFLSTIKMSPMIQDILYWVFVAIWLLAFVRLVYQLKTGAKTICDLFEKKVRRTIKILMRKIKLKNRGVGTSLNNVGITLKLGKPDQEIQAQETRRQAWKISQARASMSKINPTQICSCNLTRGTSLNFIKN